MLSLLFNIGKKRNSLEDEILLIQEGNSRLQNKLIKKYKPFIAKTVSSVCKRYIDETDDEFSIGLIAFNEAIEKYSVDKGSSLLSFAELLIKRRVIDYIRKEARVKTVTLVAANDNGEENVQSKIESDLSIDDYEKKIQQEHRKEEIIHFQKVLVEFGLTFSELVENSPKHADARQNAMLVAKTLVEEEGLIQVLFDKKQLPIKQLEAKVDVSRKTIERNRKYIIAMAIIMVGDYLYLKDYIKGVLEA
ncbi:RNA polymerase sigma factor SigI [Bacillus luteolus]|uniref:RNA polymerase sigma factor SigI n=1 Tax=Litchfieldia luteola TaxID=682179 RepID=A0ABR9QLU9_9BACI|nr:RNA polymerase sigma factor SigI [Cytobacillus luteolus]MBE4909490.1 RNA polymerase sigma factor SigI [Cytobacillus luteolus]MBP1940891.1 RNA polymerase sigma factor [Cytobacillus luteolus]